jgi:hypothetical protein
MDQKNNEAIKVWPGAFGAFKPSRSAVRKSLSTLIWLAVLDILVNIVVSIILKILFGNVGGSTIYDVGSLFISAFFIVTQVYIFLKGIEGRRVELNEVYNAVKPFWMRMVLLDLLIVVTVIGGLILLIIPGIYFALRLSLAPYFLVDKNTDVMDAYKASWEATKGNTGKILGIIGVYILMVLPTITVIGIIATVYLTFMYGAVYALFYVYLRDKKPEVDTKEA